MFGYYLLKMFPLFFAILKFCNTKHLFNLSFLPLLQVVVASTLASLWAIGRLWSWTSSAFGASISLSRLNKPTSATKFCMVSSYFINATRQSRDQKSKFDWFKNENTSFDFAHCTILRYRRELRMVIEKCC